MRFYLSCLLSVGGVPPSERIRKLTLYIAKLGPPHTALEVARVDAPGLEPSSRCCGEVKECWAHWPGEISKKNRSMCLDPGQAASTQAPGLKLKIMFDICIRITDNPIYKLTS